jgi:hypothetical protein
MRPTRPRLQNRMLATHRCQHLSPEHHPSRVPTSWLPLSVVLVVYGHPVVRLRRRPSSDPSLLAIKKICPASSPSIPSLRSSCSSPVACLQVQPLLFISVAAGNRGHLQLFRQGRPSEQASILKGSTTSRCSCATLPLVPSRCRFLTGTPASERTKPSAATPICSLQRSPPTRYTP